MNAKMNKKLIIIGASGFGREVAWVIKRINIEIPQTWNLLGFVDDNEEIHNTLLNDIPVLGSIDILNKIKDEHYVVCAIANPFIREKIISLLEKNSLIKYATIIDPSVILDESSFIAEGCIICANTIITVNAFIEKHSLINLSCSIGHDAHINKYVTMYPQVSVSGNVIVQENVEIGTGSQIIQGVRIGSNSIIGAGSVVIKDIPNNCTAVGVPAKPVKFHT